MNRIDQTINDANAYLDRSIVVSTRSGQTIVVTERCGVEYARSVADENAEPCGEYAIWACDECGFLCGTCVEATCCNGSGHTNLRRI